MLSAIRNIIRSSVTPRAVAVGCNFSTGQTLSRGEDRKMMLASVPKKDEGTVGENAIAIDSLITDARMKVFPDGNTQNTLINGAAFKDIPICNIRVSKNNTIITITDTLGNPKLLRSCGIEGFKNTRKGTNIAAQATAISVATKALEKGFKQVRVNIRGIGPGRMSSIKGLQMGGLNVVSITDCTRVTYNPLRARKQRKL